MANMAYTTSARMGLADPQHPRYAAERAFTTTELPPPHALSLTVPPAPRPTTSAAHGPQKRGPPLANEVNRKAALLTDQTYLWNFQRPEQCAPLLSSESEKPQNYHAQWVSSTKRLYTNPGLPLRPADPQHAPRVPVSITAHLHDVYDTTYQRFHDAATRSKPCDYGHPKYVTKDAQTRGSRPPVVHTARVDDGPFRVADFKLSLPHQASTYMHKKPVTNGFGSMNGSFFDPSKSVHVDTSAYVGKEHLRPEGSRPTAIGESFKWPSQTPQPPKHGHKMPLDRPGIGGTSLTGKKAA